MINEYHALAQHLADTVATVKEARDAGTDLDHTGVLSFYAAAIAKSGDKAA